MRAPLLRRLSALVLATLLTLAAAGCGSRGGAVSPSSCAATAMGQLGGVVRRVYGEAVSSDTTRTAVRLLRQSPALRVAVRRGDRAAATAAVRPLIASGHLARLEILRGGRPFLQVGTADALARTSTIVAPGATMVLSVQTAQGLERTVVGLTGGTAFVRAGSRLLAGRDGLPPTVPASGIVEYQHQSFAVSSFAGQLLSGAPVQIGLLRSVDSLATMCAPAPAQTALNAVKFSGLRIYAEEAGLSHSVATQLQRIERDGRLLRAVRRGKRAAVRAAIVAVLNQHIVRLRVLGPRGLVVDVGGPHVLAPHRGPLVLRGRRVGSFVLSVQDDLGYLLLAQRLIGVQVVMHQGRRAVLSTLRPAPANLPAAGPITWGGIAYEAFSFDAAAFPTGTLRISLLLPQAAA